MFVTATDCYKFLLITKPELVHGVDYFVVMGIDDKQQPVTDFWVEDWKPDFPPPTVSEVREFMLANPQYFKPGPKQVSMRQARLVLLNRNLIGSVTAIIAALPSPQKEAAQIEWEYATTVQRNSDLVALLSSGLGLTSEQIDELFLEAAKL